MADRTIRTEEKTIIRDCRPTAPGRHRRHGLRDAAMTATTHHRPDDAADNPTPESRAAPSARPGKNRRLMPECAHSGAYNLAHSGRWVAASRVPELFPPGRAMPVITVGDPPPRWSLPLRRRPPVPVMATPTVPLDTRTSRWHVPAATGMDVPSPKAYPPPSSLPPAEPVRHR